jgi:hypothetical protein
VVTLPADELFGPDGTQALQADEPLGDPLGGMVTGAVFSQLDLRVDQPAATQKSRVVVPDAPAAPDQAPLRAAMDKAMMTGPPTNPLRLPTARPGRYVRPAPTVSVTAPPLAARAVTSKDNIPQPFTDDEIRDTARITMSGRPSLRRRHPVVSALVRGIVGIIFILLLLYLVLKGSGSGGNLSNLFG